VASLIVGKLRPISLATMRHSLSLPRPRTEADNLEGHFEHGRALDALDVAQSCIRCAATRIWQRINLVGYYFGNAGALAGPSAFRALRGADATVAQSG
jgi:hypothetical protein